MCLRLLLFRFVRMENCNCVLANSRQILPNREEHNSKEELRYSDYLKLEQILNAQNLRSIEFNQPAHHEHLFIITHQVYELWFKQIIFELDSLRHIFKNKIENEVWYEMIKRLHRIVLIVKLLIEQLSILETMTSSDFLEFREFLCPASGFQSVQFRLIENKIGLSEEYRVPYQKKYMNSLDSLEEALNELKQSESEPNLLYFVQQWLEYYPWQIIIEENFMTLFEKNIRTFLKDKYAASSSDAEMCLAKNKQLLFDSLFDMESHNKLVEQKVRKLSRRALLGALIISVYHSEPEFSAPYNVLNLLVDLDLHLIKWRYNHMLMVQKMIGSQSVGTGGSSGYNYLHSTTNEQYKVFVDLANLPTFFIPQQYIPPFTTVKKNNANTKDN